MQLKPIQSLSKIEGISFQLLFTVQLLFIHVGASWVAWNFQATCTKIAWVASIFDCSFYMNSSLGVSGLKTYKPLRKLQHVWRVSEWWKVIGKIFLHFYKVIAWVASLFDCIYILIQLLGPFQILFTTYKLLSNVCPT